MVTLNGSSQQRKHQKVQDDKYTNLDPKPNPDKPGGDPIRNPDPERRPGVPDNPSQFPQSPTEIPAQGPNEVPENPDQKYLYHGEMIEAPANNWYLFSM